VILAIAAVGVAALLAVLPAIGAGTGTPIAVGAGVLAVGFTAWSVTSGATPPLVIAVLLLIVDYAGVIVFGQASPATVPIAAAGLYLLVELAVRSLETRGRYPGWRDFRRSDVFGVAGVTILFGVTSWFVAILATGFDPPGGIFMHSVGIAAAAAVIGVIWLLVGRDASAD
jgi:hypothetical protein